MAEKAAGGVLSVVDERVPMARSLPILPDAPQGSGIERAHVAGYAPARCFQPLTRGIDP